jgi:hypothetical protein
MRVTGDGSSPREGGSVAPMRLRLSASDKKSKGARRCSWRGKGISGGGGKERAVMALDAFKAARWGSRGGGIQSEAVPCGEEVGEGPDSTYRRWTASNGPATVCTSGTRVGNAQTGEDGALTRGPSHCAGF